MPDEPMEEPALPHRILDAAEAALRRYGSEKTNVVDIARSLGMSHANIYRHFPSKKELLQAVAARWLETVTSPLDAIAADTARSATERLGTWFETLRAAKRAKVTRDPELFRAQYHIVNKSDEMVVRHLDVLLSQVERMVADGIAASEFHTTLAPAAAARTLLLAMSAFHHPLLILQDPSPTEEDARNVLAVLLAGLQSTFADRGA